MFLYVSTSGSWFCSSWCVQCGGGCGVGWFLPQGILPCQKLLALKVCPSVLLQITTTSRAQAQSWSPRLLQTITCTPNGAAGLQKQHPMLPPHQDIPAAQKALLAMKKTLSVCCHWQDRQHSQQRACWCSQQKACWRSRRRAYWPSRQQAWCPSRREACWKRTPQLRWRMWTLLTHRQRGGRVGNEQSAKPSQLQETGSGAYWLSQCRSFVHAMGWGERLVQACLWQVCLSESVTLLWVRVSDTPQSFCNCCIYWALKLCWSVISGHFIWHFRPSLICNLVSQFDN